jgi:hypothetical protein
MNAKTRVILWAAIGIVLIYVGLVIITETRESFGGYYLRQTVTIKAANTNNMNEYLTVAVHEYGHHVWYKYMTKTDFQDWLKAIKNCGYQYEYTTRYRSKSVKIEEEFAENLAMYYNNEPLCTDKIEVLKRYGIHK